MELNQNNRRRLRLHGYVFAALFLAAAGLMGWLSTRYHAQADWTGSGRHTLSEASIAMVAALDEPVLVTAFVRDNQVQDLRQVITEFVARYQRHKPDIHLTFVNPDLRPDKVRAHHITTEGEMVIEYQGRLENVPLRSNRIRLGMNQALPNPAEEDFTNALQRLARDGERSIVFLQGHGERLPLGGEGHDLGGFSQKLQETGFSVQSLKLVVTPRIPDDTTVLVIASPLRDLLPGEVEVVRSFVEKGGNLLWFVGTDGTHGLDPVADLLGLKVTPGIVVDPSAQELGNVMFAIVTEYPPHPATQRLDSFTLFPIAAALTVNAPQEWNVMPLLRTVPESWSETNALDTGTVAFDTGTDVPGPLDLGLTLSRDIGAGEARRTQRIVVVGNVDFLSNNYLGQGDNLDLGRQLANWVSHDDDLIHLPAHAAADTSLAMTPTFRLLVGVGLLLLVPGLLLGSGAYIWLRRRRR